MADSTDAADPYHAVRKNGIASRIDGSEAVEPQRVPDRFLRAVRETVMRDEHAVRNGKTDSFRSDHFKDTPIKAGFLRKNGGFPRFPAMFSQTVRTGHGSETVPRHDRVLPVPVNGGHRLRDNPGD